MGKRNNKSLNLTIEFETLVQRYLALTEDYIFSIDRLSNKRKNFFNSEEKSHEEHKEMFFYQDKINNTINASFTYSFSIFEIFLKKVLLNEIKNNRHIKERFFGKWDNLISKGDYQKYGITPKILRSANKQYENYDVLIRHEKTTLLEFMLSLFGFKKPKGKTFFSEYMAYYNLTREVRNALTHRGDYFDQTLIDCLDRNKYLKNNPEILKSFYTNHSDKKEKDSKKVAPIKTSSIIGNKIRIDFIKTVSTLIFLSGWFVINLSKDGKDGSSIANNYNDINLFVHKNECKHLLEMVERLFLTYKKHICNNDIAKVGDVDIFNFLLANDLHKTITIKSINRAIRNLSKNFPKEKRDEIKEGIKNRLVQPIIDRQQEVLEEPIIFTNIDKNHQNLLNAYLKNDFKSFMKHTKLIKPKKDHLDHWFVFKKFKNREEFKSYYNKITKQKS